MTEFDLQYYGDYAPILQETEQMVLDELNRIIQSITQNEEYSPAEHIRSRIKSSASMQEKLQKREVPSSAENALKEVSDAVGIRIVTHFIGDVYTILQKIQECSCWKVLKIKDYIAEPKPNGYRSLHVIVQIPFADERIQSIKAEIQLRTIAMDCWASLEHQMKYKKNIENAALIISELHRCADEMASTDMTMQTIRDMIQKDKAD